MKAEASERRDCISVRRDFQGFELKNVCWGYRDFFQKSLESLFAQGLLGKNRPEVTARLFEFLKRADRVCFDHVLHEFLCALNPHTSWLMRFPGIFGDIVEMGRRLAESKLQYGLEYFRILGNGGFGKSPDQVQRLIGHLKQLNAIDEALSIAFLKGYILLIERLKPDELEKYVTEGVRIFQRNRSAGTAFMNASARSSENVIRTLTRECRLEDIRDTLARMIKALAGYEVKLCDVAQLDSDELITRGTRVVCLHSCLYLPGRVRYFDTEAANYDWYMLTGIVSAAMLAENSFCRFHGYEGYSTCRDLAGSSVLSVNLFHILEIVRSIAMIRKRWPGAGGLLDFGFESEFSDIPPATGADRLLHDALDKQASCCKSARKIAHLAGQSKSAFDTAQIIRDMRIDDLMDTYPDLDRRTLRTYAFIPDLLYPASFADPPDESLIASLTNTKPPGDTEPSPSVSAETNIDTCPESKASSHQGRPETAEKDNEQAPSGDTASSIFLYDEWNLNENDYYRNYCIVRVKNGPGHMSADTAAALGLGDIMRVRRLFELFKPELIERKKYLEDGDAINPDLLTRYLAARRQEPSPKVDFYERHCVKRRDLAVIVLLDISGSTAEYLDGRAVIDIEKEAAVLLGHGLATLGDAFAICGFSSNGRGKCEYIIYKDFQDVWEREAIERVLSALPQCSTRMGPALRHSGNRLMNIDSRQRLIFLITDGKPQDSEYDPSTRYAHYDVRKANEENLCRSIHTYCISTQENSRADMEIMFPNRQFVIISDLRKLPHILPRLYVRLTC